MSTIQRLGLFVDSVEDAMCISTKLLNKAKAIVKKYGTPDNSESINVDMDDIAMKTLPDVFDVKAMTNSFIVAYYTSLTDLLNACSFFQALGIKFNSYINCDDSHIFVEFENGSAMTLHDDDDLSHAINIIIVEKLYAAIKAYLRNDLIYPMCFIEDDIKYNLIDESDIEDFFTNGVLNDNIIKLVEENAVFKDTKNESTNDNAKKGNN